MALYLGFFVVGFIVGAVLMWFYNAAAQAKIKAELDALKSSATNAINKL